ncbi:DUF2917 domain-containing protein [Roseimicrobium sp. ORNL1]|uniref:DUF2917 domain-containing protein n=1 Tax=Roseimicrobium sp. ORNL1 TaxID=2711231 RepID=UPI0013E1AD7A|nr:DUF2917 domain-containing protein [Roseimicrobium sp. ORNL1]QIF03022.1 DUF2917 domain-containing protein [Roseimicrobium sp. ORNL1]
MRASVWSDETTLDRETASPASKSSRSTNPSTSWKPTPKSPTVQLARGGTFSKPLEKGERVSVTVTAGHAWITMEGDAQDHVLTVHERHEFAGPGLLVIEGLEQGARIQL